MIAVRLATIEDAEAIAHQTASVQQLHTDALPDIFKPPSPELFPRSKLEAFLKDPNAVVAVAELDGRVVGHIYGAVVRRTENEFGPARSYIYIHQIGVADDARRQGAGTALVRFMQDRARELSLTSMQVDHWAFNARAHDFFEACGFVSMKIVMHRPVDEPT